MGSGLSGSKQGQTLSMVRRSISLGDLSETTRDRSERPLRAAATRTIPMVLLVILERLVAGAVTLRPHSLLSPEASLTLPMASLAPWAVDKATSPAIALPTNFALWPEGRATRPAASIPPWAVAQTTPPAASIPPWAVDKATPPAASIPP